MVYTIQRPHKRLFLALLCLSLLCMALISYTIWKISFLGLMQIHQYLPLFLGFFFATIFLFGWAG